MRTGQDFNTAPRKASVTLGTHLAPIRAVTGSKGQCLGSCPSQLSCISEHWAEPRLLWQGLVYGQGFREEPTHQAVLSSRSVSHYCCLSISFTGRALPHIFVDYTQKNTVIQKHFSLLISILTTHHLYLSGGRRWKRWVCDKKKPYILRWFEQKTLRG